MLGSVRVLDEQITNVNIENKIDKEIILQHNAEETLYKANITRRRG